MKILIVIFFLYTSFVNASDIDEYKYYQINDVGNYIVYLKKNDPCINTFSVKRGTIKRFCKMAESGINLEKDLNSQVYATEFFLSGTTFRFVVAASWMSQKCEIYLPKNKLTCVPEEK